MDPQNATSPLSDKDDSSYVSLSDVSVPSRKLVAPTTHSCLDELQPPATTAVTTQRCAIDDADRLVASAVGATASVSSTTTAPDEASLNAPVETTGAATEDERNSATSGQDIPASASSDLLKTSSLPSSLFAPITSAPRPNASYCPIVTCVPTVHRFNIMVFGPTGAGKTCFCFCVFRRHFPDFNMDLPNGPTRRMGVCGKGEKVLGNERIIVTVTDTVGHGDGLDVSHRLDDVVTYIEERNAEYERNQVYLPHKSQEDDTRIHCLFYFFAPHRVTPGDIRILRRLQSKVNIVPILSKADTLTLWELADQLRLIRNHAAEEDVLFFDFEEGSIDEDWLDQDFDRTAMVRLATAIDEPAAEATPFPHPRPRTRNVFAVISGLRHYGWGEASEDNPEHSDTRRLHTVLFQSFGKLAEKTNLIHQKWREEQQRIATKDRENRYYLLLAMGTVVAVALLSMIVPMSRFSTW